MAKEGNKYIKTKRSALSKAKRLLVGFLPRKFHCYGLGSQKTGTTTLAKMFEKSYRSGHETDPRETTQLMVDYTKGDVNKDQLIYILKKRDKLLNLEIESAYHLVYVSDVLSDIFPKAKFIITIREPYSLLESRLNWNLTSTHPAWQNFNDYFFGRHHTGYETEESILKEKRLYSLDTYLGQYSDHYRRIFENIPRERRIIIKTQELNESPEKIASFLEIDKDTLQLAHSKKREKKIKILPQMDQSFVRNRIWKHCESLIKDFFPETVHFYK